MIRSVMIVLLAACAVNAAPVPKSPAPDPFEMGRMGITFTDEGLGIASIDPKMPVAASGLKVGDEFVQVGPVMAKQRADIQRFIVGLRPGTKVTIVVNRGGEKQSFAVTIGEANDEIRSMHRRLSTTNDDEGPIP